MKQSFFAIVLKCVKEMELHKKILFFTSWFVMFSTITLLFLSIDTLIKINIQLFLLTFEVIAYIIYFIQEIREASYSTPVLESPSLDLREIELLIDKKINALKAELKSGSETHE